MRELVCRRVLAAMDNEELNTATFNAAPTPIGYILAIKSLYHVVEQGSGTQPVSIYKTLPDARAKFEELKSRHPQGEWRVYPIYSHIAEVRAVTPPVPDVAIEWTDL